ncbi:ABC transporter permease [Granulosicoccus antarcticus]|uniref:Putative D,D-dipeptide transport system permease protein DdpC n=1 Tax=Granulosicoccus antarcticus IMCC3135 TaxID=1192854 RepID=A0A2Z2NSS2_9GAMM|nr:ABC transporter permease [Granulosicoccus antarcticus]ASJ73071.1 putative D,D-dipeptide transport system permease protein DdpC [Granulosicoccus antarcticus IMCC3135]
MSGFLRTLSALVRSPQGAVGLVLCLILLILTLVGPELAPLDPEKFHFTARFAAPSAEFPLGTDWYGRDLLSRILAGSRSTILLALVATVIGTVAGSIIGIVSGYLGGRADEIIMRLNDAIMAIPSLLFALLILSVLGSSSLNAVIAIGIAFTPGMARIARSVTLQVRELDYISAAKARGEGVAWILMAELLPNVVSPIIVEATIRVAFAVMTLATLSFLGLGAQPPSPEWGLMIAEGRDHMFRSPWPILVPGVAIGLVAIAFNLLGDGLRDALNPQASS